MKQQIFRHVACVVLAWYFGPFPADWVIQVLVWMGARWDFRWIEIVFQMAAFAALEIGWPYAARRYLELFTNRANPAG